MLRLTQPLTVLLVVTTCLLGRSMTATVPPPSQANQSEVCRPHACSFTCGFLLSTCVEIPGLVDCSELSAGCAQFCAGVCSCLDNCASQCAVVSEECDLASNPLGCRVKEGLCEFSCHANCPVGIFSKSVNVFLQGLLSQLNVGIAPAAAGISQ